MHVAEKLHDFADNNMHQVLKVGHNREMTMLFAKIVTVIIAGVLTVVTARQLLSQVREARARVKPRQSSTVTKLRQDPSTGIYYPDN